MAAFLVLLSLVIGTGVLIVTTYIYGILGIVLAMCVASISVLVVSTAFFLKGRARGQGNKAGLLLARD
jgi:hypothetical protein